MSECLQVNSEWLKWVRTSLHYSEEQVGKKLRIKPEKVKKGEETGKISYDNLKEISKLYGVGSLIFFNDNTPPNKIEEVPDFRTIKNQSTDKTPEIYKEIRNARNKRKTLLKYMEELEINPITFQKINLNNEDLIDYINNIFNISKSKLSSFNIDNWIHEFENKGILIFQFYNIPVSEVRGFTFSYNNYQ